MKAIIALLPARGPRVPRTPTPRSCARTYPPGYKGDPDRRDRRGAPARTDPTRCDPGRDDARGEHGAGGVRRRRGPDDVEGAAGAEPLDVLGAERVRCTRSRSSMPSGLVMRHAHRRVGREVGEAEHRDAVVLADLVVVAGSANVSGSTPCFFRFVSWMRAKRGRRSRTPPRNRGSIAACSRDEPSP